MWTVLITDQIAHSVQSDLDLQCQQKLCVSSSVRKELQEAQITSLGGLEKGDLEG